MRKNRSAHTKQHNNAGGCPCSSLHSAAYPETTAPEYAELKRQTGREFIGNKTSLDKSGRFTEKMKEPSDSNGMWKKDFKVSGMLINFRINEHDTSHPAGNTPMLIMDVFEHAFMIDYGLKRANDIEVFFRNIDRKVVEGLHK